MWSFPLAFGLTTLDNYEGFGPLQQPQTAPAAQVAQGRSVGCGVWDLKRSPWENKWWLWTSSLPRSWFSCGHPPSTSGRFTSTSPGISSWESQHKQRLSRKKEKKSNIHVCSTTLYLTALSRLSQTVTSVHDFQLQVIRKMSRDVLNNPGSRDI